MNKITPCLWFDGNAEEAARFYTSVFKNSKIKSVTHHGEATAEASGQKSGSVLTVLFEIEGQEYLALNGGPNFKLSPAISFIVYCKTQQEIDEYWKKLSANPAAEQCGWLEDKFGLSWQIVPTIVADVMQSQDEQKTNRMMEALMPMKKLDVAALERAVAQKAQKEGAPARK